MAILTLALLALLLVGGVTLIAHIVTAGRPHGRVRIPVESADRARAMRRRAHQRIAGSAVAVLAAGLASATAVVARDWGQAFWTVALLGAAAAGCIVVALIGPPPEAAAGARSAELTPRTATSFAPSWALTAPALLAATLVVVVVATAVTATEVGGTAALEWGDATASGTVEPYPGWATALPLLALLLATGAAFLVALRRVAGWPRPAQPALFGVDDDIRRACTRMLLVGTAGALLGALGGFGVEVAGAWGTALLNERGATTASPDPTLAESVWGFLAIMGAAAVVVGLALMAGAPLAGRVRQPLLEDRVRRVGESEVMG